MSGSPVANVTRLQDLYLGSPLHACVPPQRAPDATLSASALNDDGAATGLSGDYPDKTRSRRPGRAVQKYHDSMLQGRPHRVKIATSRFRLPVNLHANFGAVVSNRLTAAELR